MKRNDWAGGFWAKAAAFLLAVVLVPVTLVYGAAFTLSYAASCAETFMKAASARARSTAR